MVCEISNRIVRRRVGLPFVPMLPSTDNQRTSARCLIVSSVEVLSPDDEEREPGRNGGRAADEATVAAVSNVVVLVHLTGTAVTATLRSSYCSRARYTGRLARPCCPLGTSQTTGDDGRSASG